jgi:hypothetical protein
MWPGADSECWRGSGGSDGCRGSTLLLLLLPGVSALAALLLLVLPLSSSCSQPLWLGSVRPPPLPRAREKDGSSPLLDAAAADVPATSPAELVEPLSALLLLPAAAAAAPAEPATPAPWLLLLLWLVAPYCSSRCAISVLKYAALHSALACLLSKLKLSLSMLVKAPADPKVIPLLLLLPPSDRAMGLPLTAPP